MAEYIEREKIYVDISRLLICKSTADLTNCEDGWTSAISEAMDVIKNAPTSDVRPVRHGNWIFDSDDEYVSRYHCNQCNAKIELCNEVYTEPTPNYCSCCGALMDGKSGDTGGE